MILRCKLQDELDKQERTVYWLSKKLDVNIKTLYALANNEVNRINMELISKVAAVLGVKPLELLEEVDVNDGEGKGTS